MRATATLRRSAFIVGALAALTGLSAPPAVACSPAFEPTIAALGPNQMVVVGTTGELVQGGRLFHVERSFNVDSNTTPIVIAFKEGEAIGDCSYPVGAGTRLIIAPDQEADGRLSANLATLQADPDSESGRRYLAEAESLFGPGMVPVSDPLSAVGSLGPILVALVTAFALIAIGVAVLARRQRRVPDEPG